MEFGLLAPVLCLLAAGAIDTSRLIARTMQVRAAAQAGADYALKKGWDPAGVQQAVAGTANAGITASPAPTLITRCVQGKVLSAPTGALCAAGGTPGKFANVTAQASFQPLIPLSTLVMPSAVQAQALVRVE